MREFLETKWGDIVAFIILEEAIILFTVAAVCNIDSGLKEFAVSLGMAALVGLKLRSAQPGGK